jgi:hypothetical protein
VRYPIYAVIVAACGREHALKPSDQVKVEQNAAASERASPSAQVPVEVPSATVEPACVLSDREWRDVTLWPSVAGLEAYLSARDPAPQVVLRMRFEKGAFHVAHDTKCEMLEESPIGARVRVLEGPRKGRTGWVRHEWRVGK